MESTTSKLCQATTKKGAPCKTYALTGSAFCWWHDPTRAEDRKLAGSKGGRARHGRKLGPLAEGEYIAINSLTDVLRVLERELNAVLHLETSISRARTVGYLAGIMANIYQASELEQRLAALEAQAGMGR